jgi:hypothetical protein
MAVEAGYNIGFKCRLRYVMACKLEMDVGGLYSQIFTFFTW